MRRYIGMRYTIRTFAVNIFHFEPRTVSSPLCQNLYPKRDREQTSQSDELNFPQGNTSNDSPVQH